MASSKSKSVHNLERINDELKLLLDADGELSPEQREAFRKSALEIYRLQLEHMLNPTHVNKEFRAEIVDLAAAVESSGAQ